MLAHTLREDVDGACYFVYPDLPIIETPDPGPPLILALMAVGKVGSEWTSRTRVMSWQTGLFLESKQGANSIG